MKLVNIKSVLTGKNTNGSLLGSDTKEFLSHAVNYLGGDFLSKGLGVVSIPIFTRLLLPAEYGILAVFQSYINIFMILMDFGIRGSITRYFYEQDNEFRRFLSTNFIFLCFVNLTVLIIFSLFPAPLQLIFRLDGQLIIFGLIISVSATFFASYIAYLQASKQSRKYSFYNISRESLIVILSVVLMFIMTEKKYLGSVYGMVIINLFFFILSVAFIIKLSKLSFDFNYLKYSLTYGIPVLFHSLSGFILQSIGVVIMSQLLGEKETGIYFFAYQAGMVLYLIVLAMNKAYVPILYEKLNSQDFHSVQKLAVKYSGIIYIAAVFLVLFTREIVMLLAGRQYYEGLGMVPLVVLCYCFVYLYTLYVNYSFYLKKTVSIAVSTLISGLINIGLNYMFIPLFGYYGAVYSSLFAFFFLFLFNFLNVRYFLKELQSISLLSVSKGLLFVLGAIIIFYTVDYYVGNIIFSLLIRVIYLAGVIYYFLRKRG